MRVEIMIRSVSLAAAALLAGCLSDRSAPTLWPPSDFSLSVLGERRDEDGIVVLQQRFFVDYDGLAIYREADDFVGDRVPVFDVVSEYQLDPQSVRILSRLVGKAGLFRDDIVRASNAPASDRAVEIQWTAFGSSGRIDNLLETGGVLDRVVHVVNAFLPATREFRFDGLSGDSEPPRVSRAPEPLEWTEGALRRHRWYVDRFEADRQFAVDALAIACRARDRNVAEAMLREVENRTRDERGGVVDEGPRDAVSVDDLRRLVEGLE